MSTEVDCLIAGGGPAGAAAGILLAQAGRSVIIAEKQTYPRFHIGESLIPAVNPILRRMGVWERMDDAGFLRKYGAEFLHGAGENYVHNVFAKGLIPGYEYTYEVERAKFDALLLGRAAEVGCAVRQPATVGNLEQSADGWRATLDTPEGTEAVHARYLLDATGRTRLLPRLLKIDSTDYALPKRFAVFNHFRGVQRRMGKEAGNITITRTPCGWFWSIPLDAERTSVGLVTKQNRDRQRPEDIFRETLAAQPFMREWMRDAEPLDEFRVEADYSYRHLQMAGDNWLLLGDSAGFIDPVFSSGVMLALESAQMAEKTLTLATGRAIPRRAQQAYQAGLAQRMDVMLTLVSLFYDDRAVAVFLQPTDKFQLFAAVNSIVAGHTQPSFPVRWRYALFRLICRLQRRHAIVQPIEF